MSDDGRYDIIIVGSGPGGGTLALRLAPTGKRILILERGDYLPRERDNWDAQAVFVDGKYQTRDSWYDGAGHAFRPGLHHVVGGNSKVYGGALYRLRAEDFGELALEDGVSPAWPLGLRRVRTLLHRGREAVPRARDPRRGPDRALGQRPLPLPAGAPRAAHPGAVRRADEDRPPPLSPAPGHPARRGGRRPAPYSACVRCDAFDGFPCLTNGKADAQIICVDPALAHPNVTLLTGAYVERLETDASGRTVTAVHVVRGGAPEVYRADVVAVAAGALSSALLMFRSASDAHPNGLANGSDQVGRNYMRHNNSAFMAVSRAPNDTVFQKTMALSDFYFGADDYDFPLGCIQMIGKSHGAQVRGEALPGFLQWFPDKPFDELARHSLDFWVMTEDLPLPENRITLGRDGRVVLDMKPTGGKAHRHLRHKLEGLLDAIDAHPHLLERSLYLGKDITIGGTAHQAGTLRFGTDPASTVLNLNCRAHEVDNLYVVDAGFFPSIGAVNPTLTIIANALRVADHLAERMR